MTESSVNGDINGQDDMSREAIIHPDNMEESMETQLVEDDQDYCDHCDDDITSTPPDSVPYDEHKLFVGGLHTSTTEQTLKDYFSKYGLLREVNLKTDAATNKSRGFAFLVYEDEGAVDKALQSGPHTIDDKAIDAKKAIPHAVHQKMKNKTKKLFVGGVPTDMPEETIRSYFESFGPIEEIALVTEKGSGPKGEKKRRGFIFVTFESEDVAETACSKPFHKIESVSVEVKKATPRESESRRVQYYADHPQFMGRGAMRGNFFQTQHGRGGANWAPYGGHAYFSFIPPPYGGGYMGGGYGGYNTYGGYAYDQYSGGNRRDDANYNSRYGPMRSNYTNNHSHSHHPHHHPYSR